jgi:hypothetical protein
VGYGRHGNTTGQREPDSEAKITPRIKYVH